MSKLIDALKETLLGGAGESNGTAPALTVRVKCGKCAEVICVRIDKANDLLSDFGDDDEDQDKPHAPSGYTLHKEVVGRRCQNLVRFTMHFDARRRLVGRQIHNGEFVECRDCD